MQIDEEGIENLFVIMVLKNEIKQNFKKISFHASFLGNGLNKFQVKIW
jgi:hypothetical protein